MAALNRQCCIRTCAARYNASVRSQWYNKRGLSGSVVLRKPNDEEKTSVEPSSSLLEELRARGLVNNITNGAQLDKTLETKKITAYCGVDPTADSLHLGNLMTLMPLIHLYARGHNIIPLIGGFTCRVGDPSGRLTDREKMSRETANANIQRITRQLKSLFLNIRAYASSHGYNESEFGKVDMVNNANWWSGFKFSDFLTNVASYMRMGPMLARESVKARLQSPEGIDAASFLYQSLQAYDFYHLFSTKNCQLQIGGSDQWGNITAGIDLCQKIEPSDTKREKFGKSAGNALFLDPSYTHPFDLYQYFLRTHDTHAAQYLKIFTLLPLPRIQDILSEHETAPEQRLAQRILAEEVVTLIHRTEVAQKCVFQTSLLYPKDPRQFSASQVLQAFRDEGTEGKGGMYRRFGITEIGDLPVSRMIKEVGLVKSNSEGLRAVQNGGVFVNGRQVKMGETVSQVALEGKVLVIRFGKSSFRIVEVLSEEEEEIEGYANAKGM